MFQDRFDPQARRFHSYPLRLPSGLRRGLARCRVFAFRLEDGLIGFSGPYKVVFFEPARGWVNQKEKLIWGVEMPLCARFTRTYRYEFGS